MRWLPFFILAYVVLGVQMGAGELLAFRGAAPNLVLILVVFIAGNAPRDTALLASLMLGLFQDMIQSQPLGLYAFCYGVAGLLVAGSRQVAYSDHPLTHFVLTLGTGLLIATLLWIHNLIRPPGEPREIGGVMVAPVAVSAGVFFLTAVYTAVLAIPVLWILSKLKPLLGFRAARQRF